MDYVNPDLVAVTAYNICQQMQPDPASIPGWASVAVLIGTAAVESGLSTASPGHGLGVFGLDLNDVKRLYGDFQHATGTFDYRTRSKGNKRRRSSWRIFSHAWLGISNVPYFIIDPQDVRYLLCHDIRFACAMCRWSYLNVQKNEPENLLDLAKTWNELYNRLPKRTDTDFLDAWRKRECDMLMEILGYR